MGKTAFRTRAMMDMAAAFGHGARKGKRLSWGPGVAEFAEGWLGNRLDTGTVDYWSVRDDALQRVYEIGMLTATIAAAEGKTMIQVSHLKLALAKFKPRGYCPF